MPLWMLKVLSALLARRYSSSTPAESQILSSEPCEMSSGSVTSSKRPCSSRHTRSSSSAVAALGLAIARRGLAKASFRFHSTLKERSGMDPLVGTICHVGTTVATIQSRCSRGHGGLNLSLMAHRAPLRMAPSQRRPDSRLRRWMRSEMAPPRDSA